MKDTSQLSESHHNPDVQDDWISRVVAAAKEAAPTDQDVVDAIRRQLAGNASIRPLKPAELTAVARSLLLATRREPNEERKS